MNTYLVARYQGMQDLAESGARIILRNLHLWKDLLLEIFHLLHQSSAKRAAKLLSSQDSFNDPLYESPLPVIEILLSFKFPPPDRSR